MAVAPMFMLVVMVMGVPSFHILLRRHSTEQNLDYSYIQAWIH